MTEPALSCRDLEKRYPGTCAVAGVSLEVPEGKLLALLGPSGCGKTTTLRLLAGLERPDGGTIDVGGVRVFGPGVFVPPERRGVGLVFQSYALFPHLDVLENVAFGLPRGPGREERALEVLEQVSLAHKAKERVHHLSGGEQQRVALARALAPRPAAVLLDEPFANLDPGLRAEVREEVASVLAEAGATAILVTHDQAEALALADLIGVLDEGRLLQLAAPEEVYRSPSSLRVARLVGEGTELEGKLLPDGRVRTALGPLNARFVEEGAKGEGSCTLFVRPEALSVGEGGARGVVLSRRFLGPSVALLVELEGGERVKATVPPELGVRPGETVGLKVVGEPLAFAS